MNWKKLGMKKLGMRLLFPRPVLIVLLCILAAVLLAYSLAGLAETAPISIVSYALSFWTLVLVCVRVPNLARRVQRFRQENRYYLRYQNDVQLRVNLSLYGTFCFNAVYALFQLCLGLKHHSIWFYAMACYYLLLALMRLTLMRHMRHHHACEDAAQEWRKYRFCGVLLLIMNLTLMIFTLYFVYRIRIFQHHEITVITMAAYTFAALTIAIVNAIRYRKYGSPAYSAAKAISLASATVSMLTLENAMLTTFGQDTNELFVQLILSTSGIAVILVVQGIALHMIVTASRNLKNGARH